MTSQQQDTGMIKKYRIEHFELLIIVGSIHYAYLLAENELLDFKTCEIKGNIDYATWVTKMIDGFIDKWGDDFDVTEALPTIADTYLLSKACVIGHFVYSSGSREFATWSTHFESKFNHQEARELKPLFLELYEYVVDRIVRHDIKLPT